MKIKRISAKTISDSRKKKTIQIEVNNCLTSAPSGASIGKHEKPAYIKSVEHDISVINSFDFSDVGISKFEDLEKIERILKNKIGANSLFALESSILKALAKERKRELYQLLGNNRKIPLLLSNIVGGGKHSHNKLKPDFQEFLILGNKNQNIKAYQQIKEIIKAIKKNDEGAWQTEIDDEKILDLFSSSKFKIGVDIAASEFYKNSLYYYAVPKRIMTRKEQIDYIIRLIKRYKLFYVEDPLHQDDFSGFADILKRTKNCLICGDDLTVTNLERLRRAIKKKSINAMIIKPNQTGSLLEVKKVIDLCKKSKIKTVMSHRSGETMDDTISDLAVAWGCDYMKISVGSRERIIKIKRLEEIGKKS